MASFTVCQLFIEPYLSFVSHADSKACGCVASFQQVIKPYDISQKWVIKRTGKDENVAKKKKKPQKWNCYWLENVHEDRTSF